MKGPTEPTPEELSWLPGRLLFFFMRGLFTRAQELKRAEDRGALEAHDLIPMPRYDHSELIVKDFNSKWDDTPVEHDDGKPAKLSDINDGKADTDRVQTAVWAVLGRRFIVAGFIKIVNTCLQFAFPLLLNRILRFIEDSQAGKIATDAPWTERYAGYWLSAILFLAQRTLHQVDQLS